MIALKKILPSKGIRCITGPQNPVITAITSDSRTVIAGSMFFAVKGTNTDGHDFILNAIEAGATCIVCNEPPVYLSEKTTIVLVDDSSSTLGETASAFYGFPSKQLKLVGVTGTNGKTTTVSLLYQLFKKLGYKTGLISTVIYIIDNIEFEAQYTTPDATSLNKMLSQMVIAGCEYCFMEVSSHAVDQKRIAGLSFTGGVFTNITHDHLDYHKTFDNYLLAKKQFFDSLQNGSFALVNIDDKRGRIMVQNTNAKIYTYSLKSMSNFKARIIESHSDGMLLQIDKQEIWSSLIGEFNAYNLLAVFGVAILLEKNQEEVLPLLSLCKPVSGRFEYIQSPDGALGIIDYAHTPDALLNVLKTIRQFRRSGSQIITITGAGGNRDKAKRPLMAGVAVALSDKVILTSDNPRNENPEDILTDMYRGVEEKDKSRVLVVSSRKDAIKTACMMLHSGDILLVAGKGHETYQEIAGIKSHFSDWEEVQEAFNLRVKN